MRTKTCFILLATVVLSVTLVGCGGGTESVEPPTASIPGSATDSDPSATSPISQTAPPAITDSLDTAAPPPVKENLFPQVVVHTSLGDISVRLNAEKAPVTVENFLENYVDRRFYEGTTFHYVEKGFIIAGGGYTAEGQAKETRAPIRNEANNGLKNVRGTIAMTRQADYADSATSQFFINLTDNTSLLDYSESEDDDAFGGYCVFGEVVKGLDVVDKIAAVAVHDTDSLPMTPTEPVVISSVERVE